ncbi:MAG: type II secretory ATPase GspE/PulE/Tfp pilus assembly ATPase PilB-like protein [Planctomycetota bacterium]|jgi:type II secretory ATPase GspE/PulE/Tfp pilus assembly ATPase PilB-like protein
MVEVVQRVRLGEALISGGVLTEPQLQVALAEQKQAHRPLGEVLLSLGFARPEEVSTALAASMGIPFVRGRDLNPDSLLVSVLDPEFIRESGAYPIRMEAGVLKVAMTDPADPQKVDLVRNRFRSALDLHLITDGDLEVLIRQLDTTDDHAFELELKRASKQTQYPVEDVVQSLLQDANDAGATDIHIEPEEDLTRIRYRIDGVLQSRQTLPREFTPAVLSRIKILSGLDISERRRPQDGRLRVQVHGKHMNMRLSLMPSAHGENAVLRVLDSSSGGVQLGSLGVHGRTLSVLKTIPERSHGLFLVTGPTGSGKSTTLYAMLAEVDAIYRKVVTIEDPIEYTMPLVRQSQVDNAVGFTFHEGLRSILRQDPDVILVGEIRDQETADMAVKASMTGHLVFATLHTNTAVGAVARLIDLGIPPYLIEDSLVGVLGQRLVRKICDGCAVEEEPTEKLIKLLGENAGTARKGMGCKLCHGTGYSGRTVIGELFLPNDDFASCMSDGFDPQLLQALAKSSSMKTVFEDGLEKVRMGVTTLEEVERIGRGHRLTEAELEDI